MNLKLIHFSEITEEQYDDYINEWEQTGEDIIPQITGKRGLEFKKLQVQWEMQEIEPTGTQKYVRATLFYLVDNNFRIIGAIHLRHKLNITQLEKGASHIGAGVRLSERNKGYGSFMLKALLDSIDINETDNKVSMTVRETNIGSIRTLERNGGIHENTFLEDGFKTRRYWIYL